MKLKCPHFDKISIISYIGCHFDNFQCKHCWKCLQQNSNLNVLAHIVVLLKYICYCDVTYITETSSNWPIHICHKSICFTSLTGDQGIFIRPKWVQKLLGTTLIFIKFLRGIIDDSTIENESGLFILLWLLSAAFWYLSTVMFLIRTHLD